MCSQPNFARLERALMLEGEPDRVPLFEIGVDSDVMQAFLGKPVGDMREAGEISKTMESFVEFWITAGYDYVPIQCGIGQMTKKWGRKAKAKYSIYTDESQDRDWNEEGTGVIASLEDFQRFPWPKAEEMDYSAFDTIGRYLPSGMKVIAVELHIFLAVLQLMGFENFCISLVENPDLVARMFEKIGTIQYEVLENITGFDCVGAVVQCDDVAYKTSLMVNPKYLRKYLFPHLKRMNALCKEKDLPTIYHCDGKVDEIMEDIVSAGFNALQPIEPMAMDIASVKRQWGDKLCLCGNIDLGYTLTRGTPVEVEGEVKQRLREIAPGGGYCLGSGNTVTRYVPLENFNAMRQAVFKYGNYPISI